MPIDEKKLLRNFAKAIGNENLVEELEQKKAKEAALLESMNNALTKLSTGEKKKVEKAFEKPVPLIIEEVPVGVTAPASKPNEPKPIPLGAQPLPQLPQKDFVTRAVDAISAKSRDEYVAAIDNIPDSIRKELDILKKTVTDLHRFASRASQMGGGGEVNLRYLDDIDRSSIQQGHFLTYDNSTKKFIFSQIAEGNVDLSHIDQDLTPGANGVHDLGSPTDYWANVYVKSLFLDQGGIHANGSLGENNQVLTSNGSAAYWSTTTTTSDRLTSGNYEVILANTGQLNLPSANNAESNNARIQSAANIDILSNLSRFTFGTDGQLSIPGNIIPQTNLVATLGNTSNYWGNSYLEAINIPTGSVISGANTIDIIVAPLVLASVVATSNSQNIGLDIGDYGLTTGFPAPWTVYEFTTEPAPVLEIGDVLSGAGVPLPSYANFIGSGANSKIVIANTTLYNISEAAWPQPDQSMFIVRPIVNAGLVLKTGANTDITINPGPGGVIVPHSDIIPYTDKTFYLGTPTKRFKGAFFGSNTVFVLDETTGVDIGIGAANNLLYITGSAGIRVGEFTLRDNQIAIANGQRDVLFGATLATGNVVFNRPIAVKSYDTGNTTFAVTREGKVSILTPSIPAGDIGAMSIIGSANGYYQGVTNPGGMLHITGNDNVATRVTIDSFGVNGIPAIVGRDARGTAESPTNTLANDVLIRVSAIGWTGGNNFTIPGVTVAPTAIEAQATENYSNTTIGSKWNFYNAPTGNITRILSASIDTTGLTTNGVYANSLSTNVVIATANVTTNTLYANSINTNTLVATVNVSTNNITLKTITANGTTGNTDQVLVSSDATGNVHWANVSTVYKPFYGSFFYSGANVELANTSNAYIVPITNTATANGITIDGNNSIQFTQAGIYQFNFSIQYQSTDNDTNNIDVWLRKNTVDIDDSSSMFTIAKKGDANHPGALIAITPFILEVAANDKIQVMTAVQTGTGVSITTIPAKTTPTSPRTPAVIYTVTQIRLS